MGYTFVVCIVLDSIGSSHMPPAGSGEDFRGDRYENRFDVQYEHTEYHWVAQCFNHKTYPSILYHLAARKTRSIPKE